MVEFFQCSKVEELGDLGTTDENLCKSATSLV